jgi:outer membrane lipoprotein LolB
MTVTDANGVTIDGAEARRVAAGFVGVPLPLPQLRYWLVGAPAPDSPYRETMGEGARLAALEQAGWQVRYTRYGAAGARILPERLELTAGDVRLRLSVGSWQFAP